MGFSPHDPEQDWGLMGWGRTNTPVDQEYPDDGCKVLGKVVSESCLTCPLMACKHESAAANQAARDWVLEQKTQFARVFVESYEGPKVEAVQACAEKMGCTPRSVWRYLEDGR